MPRIRIGDRNIGDGCPVFIVAEAGINHNGSLELAKKMIRTAKECGVDAIKFQTFRAEEFISDEKQEYEYESQGKKIKESMLGMFRRYEFGEQEWRKIADYCREQGLIFFSTPQNPSDLELLLRLEVPAIKVGSDDLVNLPLLEEYSRKGLPLIISTGMAYEWEIEDAVNTVTKNNDRLIILHCVSSYPTDIDELNLKKINSLIKKYPDHVIGFSDHSRGKFAASLSVAAGAKMFEKHFTLDRNMPGPDHWFSADPLELKEIVAEIRKTEIALGQAKLEPTEKEKQMRELCHRSITALRDIRAGETLTRDNIALKRPGTGLPPRYYPSLLGRKAAKNIRKNELLSMECIENDS